MEVCYRHPDRETGVSCSNCGRPICPDCMTSTSVGMRCPECAQEKTRARTVRSASMGGGGTTLTYVLVAINVAVALGVQLGGQPSVLQQYGVLYGPAVAEGEWWRLLTAGFLHAGIGHLLFNMLALYVLGQILEPAIGAMRFGIIYFVSLLAGSFGALLVSPDAFTVGASGAVFGLMGAGVVIMRRRGINIMESGLGLWLGLNLVITFVFPGSISLGGHLGGLAGGLLAAIAIYEVGERIRNTSVGIGLAVAVGVLAVAGSLVIA
jgi:membrane associated rhomboid family serine protease